MKHIFYSLILINLFFTACEDVIEVKLNNEDADLFAVEAKITTIDEPEVFLTKGQPVTVDKPFEGLSGAIIIITDDAEPINEITLTEDPQRKGYYIVPPDKDFFGQTGRKYTITIYYEGITLTATDELKPVSAIDSIKIRPSLMGDSKFLGVYISSQETPGKGNYYKWDIFVNNNFLNSSEDLTIADDNLVDGKYVNDFEIFIDYHDLEKPEERKLKFGDTIFVKQNSVSRFAYNYFMQMYNQHNAGFLFNVPPANIKSNFTSSDGKTVLGLFSAHDVSISNRVIIDNTIESQLKKSK